VHCENLLVNYRSDRQAVETIGKGLPQFDIVPAFTCVQEIAQGDEHNKAKRLRMTHIRRKTRRFC
jgi:hypothetical protein